MKTKHILMALLALGMVHTSEGQFLKKLAKKAEQAAERTILQKTDQAVSHKTGQTIDGVTTKKERPEEEKKESQPSGQAPAMGRSENTALAKNTEAKRNFFKEDVVIKLYENGSLNQTQNFDADQVAVRTEQHDGTAPMFLDSEGFLYAVEEGIYKKSSVMSLQSQGLMIPTFLVEAYKLPPEPFMAEFQRQSDQGLLANPFNGIVEFAFIYEPDDFRYTDFKETKQGSHTKFEFLNEPGFEGSYVLFDDRDRLVEIYSKRSGMGESMDFGSMPMEPGENRTVYEYTPVEVHLPAAQEVRAMGQDLMENVMTGIVKGGNQPKDDIDEDDYDTSDQKGMVKQIRTSIRDHKVKPEDLKDSYDFDWQLETEFKSANKKTDGMGMTFLIKEGAPYQGARLVDEKTKDLGQSTMLFDLELNIMAMFMEARGNKILQIYPIPDSRDLSTVQKKDEFRITELPPKTIIGYVCQGIQLEDDRYIMKLYHSPDAPVKLANFFSMGGPQNMQMPNIEVDPRLIEQYSKGAIMEMDIVDKKKSKNNVSITARSLMKAPVSIKKAEYQSMDFLVNPLKN